MPSCLISSRSNPVIKRIRALRDRKAREQQRAFFVEGIQPVWQAVASGAALDALVVAPALLDSAPARRLVESQRQTGVPVVALTADLFEEVAERAHASGLAAIVRMPRRRLTDLSVTGGSLFVALYGVQYPGNLGTILRTVDAVGGSGVILVGDTTDPYHPQAVKASMGTLFTVPVVRVGDASDLLAWCQAHAVAVMTTSPRASQAYWSAAYPLPAVLLFGSEGQGLPEALLGVGEAVHIPMLGQADSLNLATAAGILLYEVRRQHAPVTA